MKIAIVNPFANVGHMNSYLLKYSSLLTELEAHLDVYTATLDDETYVKLIKSAGHIFSLDSLEVQTAPRKTRSNLFWKLLYKTRKVIFGYPPIWKLLYKTRKVIFGYPPNLLYLSLRKRILRICKYILPKSGFSEDTQMSKYLKIESHYSFFLKSDGKYDFVFFMYLDLYHPDTINLQSSFCETKFVGLLFHPNLLPEGKAESYIAQGLFAHILFLNPTALRNYSELKLKTTFHLVPEIAYFSPSNDALKFEIETKSSNRIVIALIGNIVGHKNVGLFLSLIELAPSNRFFFILAGQINRESLSSEELLGIEEVTCRENVFVSLKYFESEDTIDSLISVCDYLFAAYKSTWSGSANILEKSRRSGIKLIGNIDTYMGEIIVSEKLGFSLDADSKDSAFNILKKCQAYVKVTGPNISHMNDLKLKLILQEILKT